MKKLLLLGIRQSADTDPSGVEALAERSELTQVTFAEASHRTPTGLSLRRIVGERRLDGLLWGRGTLPADLGIPVQKDLLCPQFPPRAHAGGARWEPSSTYVSSRN